MRSEIKQSFSVINITVDSRHEKFDVVVTLDQSEMAFTIGL